MRSRTIRPSQREENLTLFAVAYPQTLSYLKEKAAKLASEGSTFDFPAKMISAIAQFGSLTIGQMEAVERMRKRDAEYATRKTTTSAGSPPVEVEVSKISAAFDQAISSARRDGEGLKFLHLRMGNFVCSPAGANSRNPGSIYVKEDGVYLGKITDGKFIKSRDCTPQQVEQLKEVAKDPAEAARAYGLRTGSCSICGRELTREESRERGIGPICAERFGFL